MGTDQPGESGFDFDACAAIATVSHTQHCEGCGYDLRGQAVRRDARTQLLMLRCPECGRFAFANDPYRPMTVWFRRQLAAAGVVYVVGWVVLVAVVTMFAAGMLVGTMEELRWYGPRPMHSDMVGFLSFIGMVLFAGGLVFQTLIASMLWFWPTSRQVWLLMGQAVVMVFFPFGIAWFGTERALVAYGLYPWVLPAGVLCFGLGSLLGIVFGRKVARWLVRMFLPPSWRQHTRPLWEADGLKPPE